MTTRSFRSRLEAMVETLAAHPDVVVFELHFGSPASGAVLREAEARSGFVLPEAMVEFYATHNGVFLEWGLRGETYQRTDPYEYPDYGAPPGCINMLPISAVMTKEWQSSCHVNELESGQEELFFGRKLDPERPIETVTLDNFSKFNHADLVLGPEPVVIVSTDHGADLYSSDFMSFETYLEVLLSVFATNRYAATCSDDPQRLLAPRERPGLDELIEGLRDRE